MVKSSEAASFNADYYRDRQINAVIVGGTAGIGQGIAFRIAAYSRNPVITVCGRNENPGQETISELKKINDKGTYNFERCDMSLLKETRDLAKRITAKYDKINLLVISSGYISLESYTETEDGMDARFTMFCAGRFALTYYLVPLLQAAANNGETAAALSVMTAGQGNKFMIDDIGLKENFKFTTSRSHRAVLNDVMAEVTIFQMFLGVLLEILLIPRHVQGF
jgi:NAD(P)-dependent dehydrogenase (short-subunit alcohol dehydrogenase family)